MTRFARFAILAIAAIQGTATAPYAWGPGLMGGDGRTADGGPLGWTDPDDDAAASAGARERGATATQSTAIMKFYPQAGTLWRDISLGNYVDIDPTGGILDFECNARAYDGHNGHDTSIIGFKHQAIGVPVFAVEDGTVAHAVDGNPDENTQALGQPPNVVYVNHAGGLQTRYHHLKNGSVAVSVGQTVVAGQQLGLTASSGNSTYPHLHFGVYQDGLNIEPNSGLCRPGQSNWASQIPTNTELHLLDFTFGTAAFTGDRTFPWDNVVRQGTYINTGAVQTIYFRLRAMEWPASASVNWTFRRPDGTVAISPNSNTAGGPYRTANWSWSYNVNFNQNGTWQAELRIGGALAAVAPFTVGAAIVNRAPLPASPALDPAFPGPADVTFCRVTPGMVHRQDPDYDIVRYRYLWQVNGVTVRDVTSAALSDALQKGLVQPGDSVRCTITPNDGQVDGPSSTATNLRDVNVLTNSTFVFGTTGWALFATPDTNHIQAQVNNGVLEYYRVPNGSNSAVVLQQTTNAFPAGARVNVRFKYGNGGVARKRFSVLVHDGDFSDLTVCTFWTEPGQALLDYEIVTRTTKAWNHGTVSFYAASPGSLSEFNRLDDVELEHGAGPPVLQTECHDPNMPAVPGGPDGAEMLVDGAFNNGLALPWQAVQPINAQVVGGVMEFFRSTAQAGVILQNTQQTVAQGDLLTTTFQLGNSSQWRQRITVLVHEAGFTDLHACTFWLPPGQALQTYTIITYATRPWPAAMLSFYPSTVGTAPYHQWMRLDNASLKKTPGAAVLGTACYEPGAVIPPSSEASPAMSAATSGAASAAGPGTWTGRGFATIGDGSPNQAWRIDAATGAPGTLGTIVDLRQSAGAVLTFESRFLPGASHASVQISTDGVTWTTAGPIPASSDWLTHSVDLGPYAGQVVWVRVMFQAGGRTGVLIVRNPVVAAGAPSRLRRP